MRIISLLFFHGIARLNAELNLRRVTRSFKEGNISIKNRLNHYVKVIVQIGVQKIFLSKKKFYIYRIMYRLIYLFPLFVTT